MENSGIVSIRVENLYPHPDNPRKSIGDVSELAESARKNGIMQNLTVIPLSALDTEPAEQPEVESISLLGDFHVLIGHRRLAAAKEAGLAEVPCKIISKISRKEQVGIMLEENMQREDLTIYEQAQGFQMMLDLGETEESIAEKTGFSKTTIRRRLNIAKLDQTVLKEKQDDGNFQMTLTDLYELEKVADIETRNKILSEAKSSRDIVWKAQNAVETAKREETAKKIIEMLGEAEIELAPEGAELYSGKWERVHTYSLEAGVPEKIEIKAKKETKLFYMKQWREVIVVKKAEKKKETAADVAKKENDRKKKEIKAIVKEMEARRRDFIENIISGKIAAIKDEAALKDEVWRTLVILGSSVYEYSMREFYTDRNDCELTAEEKAEASEKIRGYSVLHQMLIVMHRAMKMTGDIVEYGGQFSKSNAEKLMAGYTILEKYGWSFEGDEVQIMDGTHELYVPEVKKDE